MDKRLKDSEWIILKALWGKEPMDLKELISAVQAQQKDLAWDYKTYHSFLRILVEKGFVTAEKRGKNNLYSAAITEADALAYETESLVLRRPYYGSVSNLIISMADHGKLTRAEKQELMALAERLSREAD